MRQGRKTLREESEILIGEAVDEMVAKLREVGISIEGSQAHLTHAILRSGVKHAVGQVRRAEAIRNSGLENNQKAQR